jgi:flagellar biosynthesis chaperone FliJ
MNQSKFSEIYDGYKYGDEAIIDTVTGALQQELGDLLAGQTNMKSITPDHRFYERSLKDQHNRSHAIQDLSAFISEYYRRINPALGLGLTEQQFNAFMVVLDKDLAKCQNQTM